MRSDCREGNTARDLGGCTTHTLAERFVFFLHWGSSTRVCLLCFSHGLYIYEPVDIFRRSRRAVCLRIAGGSGLVWLSSLWPTHSSRDQEKSTAQWVVFFVFFLQKAQSHESQEHQAVQLGRCPEKEGGTWGTITSVIITCYMFIFHICTFILSLSITMVSWKCVWSLMDSQYRMSACQMVTWSKGWRWFILLQWVIHKYCLLTQRRTCRLHTVASPRWHRGAVMKLNLAQSWNRDWIHRLSCSLHTFDILILSSQRTELRQLILWRWAEPIPVLSRESWHPKTSLFYSRNETRIFDSNQCPHLLLAN